MDPRIGLVGEDCEETPSDDEGPEDVALLLLEFDVANSGGAEENDAEDAEDDMKRIGTVILDGSERSEDGLGCDEDNPAVPEAEGSVDEELGVPMRGRVICLEVVEDE